jgi:hypothetical protein
MGLDGKECDYKLCTVEDTNSKQVSCLNSSLLDCAPFLSRVVQ